MTYYIKKPVTIEAYQYKYTNRTDDFPEWLKPVISECHVSGSVIKPNGTITDDSTVINDNDYVIKDINGDIYTCHRDIFKNTYQLVYDKNKVEPQEISHLKSQITYKFHKVGEKGTLCEAYLGNFSLAQAYSACVDPKIYDKELGEKYSKEKLDKILDDKLWEFLGFDLFKDLNAELFL